MSDQVKGASGLMLVRRRPAPSSASAPPNCRRSRLRQRLWPHRPRRCVVEAAAPWNNECFMLMLCNPEQSILHSNPWNKAYVMIELGVAS
ncbi:hypothetical protein PVAP13_2KG131964 [Panicum virgatum]|uniref:Uncharacterized protein n=1 Tax=Panicum virgatum TaxID=38727 RepID=A0A8T0W0L1_PANVG|nr:hypothetical protein PVAP13_2KG131964 [Panicum virgatum]